MDHVALDWDRDPRVAVLSLTGDLDIRATDELASALGEVLESGRHLVVDATGLTFIDVAPAGALLATHRRLATAGRRLFLAGAQDSHELRRFVHATAADFERAADVTGALERLG